MYGWVDDRFYHLYPGGWCTDYTETLKRDAERIKRMPKLETQDGKIVKVSKFAEGPMSVVFKRAAIAPSGDLGRIDLELDGGKVSMTFAQGLQLAAQIMSRCH